jgi:hypothetical protein
MVQFYDTINATPRSGSVSGDAESRLPEAICGVLLSISLLAAAFLASMWF